MVRKPTSKPNQTESTIAVALRTRENQKIRHRAIIFALYIFSLFAQVQNKPFYQGTCNPTNWASTIFQLTNNRTWLIRQPPPTDISLPYRELIPYWEFHVADKTIRHRNLSNLLNFTALQRPFRIHLSIYAIELLGNNNFLNHFPQFLTAISRIYNELWIIVDLN